MKCKIKLLFPLFNVPWNTIENNTCFFYFRIFNLHWHKRNTSTLTVFDLFTRSPLPPPPPAVTSAHVHTYTLPQNWKETHYGFTIRPGTVSRKSNERFWMKKKTFSFHWNLIQVCLCVYAVYIIYIYIHYICQASIQNVSHNSSELKPWTVTRNLRIQRNTALLNAKVLN